MATPGPNINRTPSTGSAAPTVIARPQRLEILTSAAIRFACGGVRTLLLLAAGQTLLACHSMDGPELLVIAPGDYAEAFEACLDQARDAGMPAVLADRTIGLIETKPRHIGSLVEPWRLDIHGLGQMAEATVQFERRRVRFEFTPVGFTLPAPSGSTRLRGPDVPGSREDRDRFDLERPATDLELRAWVFVERGFTPGLKPGPWSLSLTSTWTDPITNAPSGDPRDESTRAPTTWTPVARDEAMERTLLARVQRQLQSRRPEPQTD